MSFSLFFSTKVIAKGGLKAADTYNFILKHAHAIQHFHPTHIVLHVGFCDRVPRSLEENVTPLDTVLESISDAKGLLESLIPAAYFLFSEPLPHCIAHDKPGYKIWNKRWRCYNKLLRQLRQRNLGFDVIRHERLWLSYCSADPDYYDLQEYFYGLHLNQTGCMIFAQDIISFVSM